MFQDMKAQPDKATLPVLKPRAHTMENVLFEAAQLLDSESKGRGLPSPCEKLQ